MRWMWIDRIVELVPGRKMVAVKNVSLAEEHLHDHFAAEESRGLPATPIMPASLIIEGMAQTGGVLVGHANQFKEKVVLAKVSAVELEAEATPGCTLRYTAEVERMDAAGASVKGIVEMVDSGAAGAQARQIGRIDLMFSFVDQNMSGLAFPAHNFVFGESFKTLLRMSGID